jgi:hypothetical protein
MAKHQNDYVPYKGQRWKLSNSDQLLLSIKEQLDHVCGPSITTHILPHFQRPDLFLCFNEKKKPVTSEFEEIFKGKKNGKIMSRDFLLNSVPERAEILRSVQFVAVVVGGWNFYIRYSDTPTGVLQMKLDQLKMVGYKPLLVNWERWARTPNEHKANFLKDEITKLLDS